jgi:hypothetical protein
MSEFVLSSKIADDVEQYSKTHSEPFLSFEFFPPKTEVIPSIYDYDSDCNPWFISRLELPV